MCYSIGLISWIFNHKKFHISCWSSLISYIYISIFAWIKWCYIIHIYHRICTTWCQCKNSIRYRCCRGIDRIVCPCFKFFHIDYTIIYILCSRCGCTATSSYRNWCNFCISISWMSCFCSTRCWFKWSISSSCRSIS